MTLLRSTLRSVLANAPTSGGPPARLRLGGGGKLATLIEAGTLAQSLYKHGQGLYNQWRSERTYTVSVSSVDPLYPDLHQWLLTQIPPSRQKALIAESSQRARRARDDDDDECSPPGLIGGDGQGHQGAHLIEYQYDGQRQADLVISGHRISVSIERERPEDDEEALGNHRTRIASDYKMVFLAHSLAGQEAVKQVLERIAGEHLTPDIPRVLRPSPWSGWTRTTALAGRDPATVILAPGQYERISQDLDRFLGAELLYRRCGIPWHRGYLLYGPPGTGKTSAAMALANEHKLDLYYLPLADLKSDTNLANLFGTIRDRAILLIEDVDISHAATSRDEDAGADRVSAQGLLNALDGAITPHGLITIMTTNRVDVLDDALLRPGRCDVREEVGYLTNAQLERLATVLTGHRGQLPLIGDRQITPAAITEIVKCHIDDLQAAYEQIAAFLAREEAPACPAT